MLTTLKNLARFILNAPVFDLFRNTNLSQAAHGHMLTYLDDNHERAVLRVVFYL